MKFFLLLLAMLTMNTYSYAWDFGGKVGLQAANTDNVNLAEIAPVRDTYSILGGQIQVKNETFKLKLKGKKEQHKSQQANDNYSVDFSVQYKHSINDDYTFGIFKQVYDGTTVISTDTTSANSGERFIAAFAKEFSVETSVYLDLTGIQKKYPKILGRNDKIIAGNLGLEYYLSSHIMINPEVNIQKNSSTNLYYRNWSWGPTLLISFTPVDYWEIFVDGNYTKTDYTDRTFAMFLLDVNGNPQNQNIKETQSLLSFDLGTDYKISKIISLQAKYSVGKNSSNNRATTYTNNILSCGLTLKM